MSRCRRTMERASRTPWGVSVMALYGLWRTKPWSLSLRTISETEELATPRRCASWVDVMGLSCHSVKE